MSMSRDGLLPPVFQKIHPRYRTPSFATIITGCLVGIPILFTDKTFVLDFTSIGTLFAFVLVCGGVLLLPRKEKQKGRFQMPYINGQVIFPAIIAAAIIILAVASKKYFPELLNGEFSMPVDEQSQAALLFKTPANKISTILFWAISIFLAGAAWVKSWSLIPLLGLLSCLYLLTGMTGENWKYFFYWFLIGLVLYFVYGYWKSKLRNPPPMIAKDDGRIFDDEHN
jgi:amino acid transporter